jgi:hypothetical protein
MADRTSAALFAMFFDWLAKKPDDKSHREFAYELWQVTGDYDFAHYQMYCDDALLALGLAKKGVDPDYPEDGEMVLYLYPDGGYQA